MIKFINPHIRALHIIIKNFMKYFHISDNSKKAKYANKCLNNFVVYQNYDHDNEYERFFYDDEKQKKKFHRKYYSLYHRIFKHPKYPGSSYAVSLPQRHVPMYTRKFKKQMKSKQRRYIQYEINFYELSKEIDFDQIFDLIDYI